METVKVEMECPKGFEEFMIAYAQEAIKIKVREDLARPKEEATEVEAKVITDALAPAKIDGVAVSVAEEPIEEPIEE